MGNGNGCESPPSSSESLPESIGNSVMGDGGPSNMLGKVGWGGGGGGIGTIPGGPPPFAAQLAIRLAAGPPGFMLANAVSIEPRPGPLTLNAAVSVPPTAVERPGTSWRDGGLNCGSGKGGGARTVSFAGALGLFSVRGGLIGGIDPRTGREIIEVLKGGGEGRSGRPGLGGAKEIPSLAVRRRLSERDD
jgi:hypothetical protein